MSVREHTRFLGLELGSIGRVVGGPCVRLTQARREKYLRMVQEFRRQYRRQRLGG
jgi:hypothetical protein